MATEQHGNLMVKGSHRVHIVKTRTGRWRWRLYHRRGTLLAAGPAVTLAGAEHLGSWLLAAVDSDIIAGAFEVDKGELSHD